MRRARLTLLLLATPLLAGCLITPVDTPGYALYGAFNERATGADHAEVASLVRQETGKDLPVAASPPADFRVVGLDNAACLRLHEQLQDKPYLRVLDTCRPEMAPLPTEEGDAYPSWEEHLLSGAYTEASRQEDHAELGALARKHGGEAAVLESFPPQFSAWGLDQPRCEAFRAEILGKPYLARVGECRLKSSFPGAGAPPDR